MKIIKTETHVILYVLGIKFSFRRRVKHINNSNSEYVNNKLYIVYESGEKKEVEKIKGMDIVFRGSNNSLVFHSPLPDFQECRILCGNNTKIEIGGSEYSVIRLFISALADNVECTIGRNFSVTNSCAILLHKEPGLVVHIGDDCMFATNISIRTSDAHTIFDKENGEVLNFGKSIIIGDHVWLAYGVSLLKGVNIASNVVIGAYSIVTKPCLEENTIYAGYPAKKIKSGICWSRENIPDFIAENNK